MRSRLHIKRACLFLATLFFMLSVAVPSALAAITINEYGGLTADSQPHGIVQGPDGNMWFAEFNVHQIGQMAPDGTLLQEYPLTPGTYPHKITVGPDGKLWFTEYGHENGVGPTGAAGIGVIDTSGNVNEYPVAGADPRPHDIVAGPDGNLWFTEIGTHNVSRIQTDGTLLPVFPLGAGVDPYGITVGPDGNMWITDWGAADQIIQMDLSGNVLNTYPITGGYSQPYDITAGPDGNMWFTLQGGSQDAVAKITTDGNISYYPTPNPNSQPHDIVAGPDGNMWYTEESTHQIGMITTAGVITDYFPTPANPSGPFGIAVGPNNTIWFAESSTAANQIGVISGLTITGPPAPPSGAPTTPQPPNTGIGIHQPNPLQTLLAYSLAATVLIGLALAARKAAKLYR